MTLYLHVKLDDINKIFLLWRSKERVSLPFPANGLSTLENSFADNFGNGKEKPKKI